MSRIFDPRNPNLPAPLVEEPEVEPVDEWQVKMLAALDQLGAAVMDRPPPIVEVPPVDLGAVVQAVQALKGPATAEEIAEALARTLDRAPKDESTNATLAEVAEALKKLDFRMQSGGTQAYGGGAVSFSRDGMAQLAAAFSGLTDTQLRATPVEITGNVTAAGASLAVSEALNFTSTNLLSAAYSGTTAISNDYQLDSLELHFTTRAKRTITLTTEDGTVVFKKVDDLSLDLNVPLGKKFFNGGEDLTLGITQTTSACSVSGKLVIAQGELALSGNPVVEQGTSPWVVSSGSMFPVRHWGQFYNVRGQRYIATTDYVPLTANAGNQPLALFKNPSGSNIVVMFDKAEFASTANTTFTRFAGGTTPLVGSPTARTIGRTDGGTSTSTMELYVGGNGAANARGTTVSAQFSISVAGTVRKVAPMLAYESYHLDSIDGTTVLQPGQQSYWTVDEPAGGGSGTFNSLIDFEWVEIPLATWTAMVTALQAKSEY